MPEFLIVDVEYRETGLAHDPLITTLRLKSLEGETVKLDVHGCVPRFWTEANHMKAKPSKITSITGTPLFEVRCSTPTEMREIRDRYYPHYCADVPWKSLVRWIYGWTAVIEVDSEAIKARKARSINIRPSELPADNFKLDTVWFDIETADSLDTENTDGRIVSIAFLRPDGAHEIGTTSKTSPRQVKRFMQSAEALESVVEHTEPIPPVDGDVITVNFDALDEDEREAGLLWWFRRRIEEIDPDVLAGQNIKDYDIPYLRNRCRNMNRAMARRHGGKAPVHHTFPNLRDVLNRPLFDSKIAYAEQVQGAATTTGAASLSWMATSELGYGKVPRTRITDLMVRDPMMLAVYNAWDNVCAERVCSKLDLINFYLIKTAFHNSTLRNSHTNMMLVEDMMGHLLMSENKVMPSVDVVRERTTGEIDAGGFVMDAPTGVWRNAFELDNSMEYPSAIITGNFSPDTKVEPAEEYPFPVTITPAGRVYRRDFEGIMPRVLRTLAELRRKTQKQMRETDDPVLAGVLNQKQRVIKENMNSWYGVLGSGTTSKTKGRPFRLTEPGIGSDITEIARIHNDWNKQKIATATLGFDKELGITLDSDAFQLEFETLYQDTDSCKVAIKNLEQAESEIREIGEDDVIAISDQLSIMLNGTYDDFVQTYLNTPKNDFFLVKRDAAYERYFQWGVKKRYAYREFGGKQGYRGVEMRRSSSPSVVKNAQQRVFDAILKGADRTALNALLREIHSDIMDENITPQIDFGTPMGMKTNTTQQFKAAMWSNNHLGTNFDIGDKPVIYLASMTKAGLPSNKVVALEYSEKPEDHGVTVDRKRSFEKHFQESRSWEAILGAFRTSWREALSGMRQATFDEWFE